MVSWLALISLDLLGTLTLNKEIITIIIIITTVPYIEQNVVSMKDQISVLAGQAGI